MIKVALNTLPLKSDHKTRGIGFYTKSLLENLKKITELQIQEFSTLEEVQNADLVHYPFFDLFQRSLPLKKRFPTIVTIHDVTPLIFPKQYPPGIKGKINYFYQKFSLKNVGVVITDSEVSKRDIAKLLMVDENKVFSIYLAPASHFKVIKDERKKDEVRGRYRLPKKFAFFAGSVNWNKNILNLTQACLNLGVDLVMVGKDFEDRSGLDHQERKSYARFLRDFAGNSRVHILGFVPDDDFVVIMNLANVALLPSFYEGFGLPILEAQACGTPVITSQTGSMPEVAGRGALLVDPYKVSEIKEAIEKVWLDQSTRLNLVEKGFENVGRFSWEKTTRETMECYEKIVSKK